MCSVQGTPCVLFIDAKLRMQQRVDEAARIAAEAARLKAKTASPAKPAAAARPGMQRSPPVARKARDFGASGRFAGPPET